MNCASKNCFYRYQKPPYGINNIITCPCPYCKTVFYCSEKCRVQDWEQYHKNSCTSSSSKAMNMSISLNTSSESDRSWAKFRTFKKKCLGDYEEVTVKNKSTCELGKGSYGSVRLVKDKSDNCLYAMKIITKKVIFEYSSVENLKREIKIQKKMDHPHIIKLLHYFEDKENVYLILQYAENGSLFRYLKKKNKFKEEEAFVYFFQTCLGIDYLHKNRIIHRDLKPENLLLDKHGNIKLCDFGWSAEGQSTKRTTFCGTIDYMAPEMLMNQPHDHKLDIWCLGVLLYELLHGVPPFKGQSENEKCRNIMKSSLDIEAFSPDLSFNIKNLIQGILKKSPKERLSMNEIFSHEWMKSYENIYNIKIEKYVWKKEYHPSVPTIIHNISPKSEDAIKDRKEISQIQQPDYYYTPLNYKKENVFPTSYKLNSSENTMNKNNLDFSNYNNMSLECCKYNNMENNKYNSYTDADELKYNHHTSSLSFDNLKTGAFSFGEKENNFKEKAFIDQKPKKNDLYVESYERLKERQMELEKILKDEDEAKFNGLSNRISKRSMKSVNIEDKYPKNPNSFMQKKDLSIMDKVLIAFGCISREKIINNK